MRAKAKLWQFFLIVYCLISISSLQAQMIDSPLPPTHLRGRQVANKFVSSTDLVNIINWSPPDGGAPPVAYRIYREPQLTKLAAIISADGKLQFKDHNRKKGRTYRYFIVSVDAEGNQSEPAGIIFKNGKARPLVGPFLTSIEVNPTNPQVPVDFTEQFSAVGIFSNGTTRILTEEVNWSSSKRRVASISNEAGNQGLALGLKPGKTVIKASLNGISGSTTLTVTSAKLVSIEVFPVNQTVPAGYTERFIAIGVFDDDTTENLTDIVTWNSSSPDIASISNDKGSQGIATGLTPGITQISATTHGVTGSTLLTVTPAVLTFIEVSPINPILSIGHTQRFIAIGVFSDFTTENLTEVATWSSSNPNVAIISNEGINKGVATGLRAGISDIVATFGGLSGSTILTVTDATLLSITVLPTDPSRAAGFTEQFSAIGNFEDGTTVDLTEIVTWSSSNPTVATISNVPNHKGLATRLAQGTTSIIASIDGVSGSTTLTVTPAVLVSLAITPVKPSVASGFKLPFTATGTYSDGTTENLTTQVTWTSSNLAIASISNVEGSQGIATGISVGETTIRAAAHGISAQTTLTVTPAVLLAITVTPANPIVNDGVNFPFTATGSYSDGVNKDITEEATWTSSNNAIAVVSNVPGQKGIAQGSKTGTVTITATLSGVSGGTNMTLQCPQIAITTLSLPNPSVGVPYSQTIRVQNQVPPVTFSVSLGQLPFGLSLDSSSGVISGIPTTPQFFDFVIRATSGCGTFAFQEYSGVITCVGPNLTQPANDQFPNGTVGVAYQSIATASGVTPINFSFNGGNLPPGLTFEDGGNNTGVLKGTPTQAGTFQFRILLSNVCGSLSQPVSITIKPR